jgi:hypothetical protein
MYLFVRARLNWDVAKFGYYSTFKALIGIAGMLNFTLNKIYDYIPIICVLIYRGCFINGNTQLWPEAI